MLFFCANPEKYILLLFAESCEVLMDINRVLNHGSPKVRIESIDLNTTTSGNSSFSDYSQTPSIGVPISDERTVSDTITPDLILSKSIDSSFIVRESEYFKNKRSVRKVSVQFEPCVPAKKSDSLKLASRNLLKPYAETKDKPVFTTTEYDTNNIKISKRNVDNGSAGEKSVRNIIDHSPIDTAQMALFPVSKSAGDDSENSKQKLASELESFHSKCSHQLPQRKSTLSKPLLLITELTNVVPESCIVHDVLEPENSTPQFKLQPRNEIFFTFRSTLPDALLAIVYSADVPKPDISEELDTLELENSSAGSKFQALKEITPNNETPSLIIVIGPS